MPPDSANSLTRGATILIPAKADSTLDRTILANHFNLLPMHSVEQMMQMAISENPSLILGELSALGKPVQEVCQIVRSHHLARHLPIIVVQDKAPLAMRIAAMQSGATDYIVQPFAQAEVLARIERSIHHSQMALDANPLTRLPGNLSIRQEMERRLIRQENFSVAYIDIDHFKSYNDLYGYALGDRVIELMAEKLVACSEALGHQEPPCFVGHVGGDDFIFIGPDKVAEDFSESLIEAFDRAVYDCYDAEILKRGFILGRDRQGQSTKFPLISLSVAVVVNGFGRKFQHVGEIASAGAEIKKYLKTLPGSVYLVDRRESAE
jgi:GGDEF domain-containing protein